MVLTHIFSKRNSITSEKHITTFELDNSVINTEYKLKGIYNDNMEVDVPPLPYNRVLQGINRDIENIINQKATEAVTNAGGYRYQHIVLNAEGGVPIFNRTIDSANSRTFEFKGADSTESVTASSSDVSVLFSLNETWLRNYVNNTFNTEFDRLKEQIEVLKSKLIECEAKNGGSGTDYQPVYSILTADDLIDEIDMCLAQQNTYTNLLKDPSRAKYFDWEAFSRDVNENIRFETENTNDFNINFSINNGVIHWQDGSGVFTTTNWKKLYVSERGELVKVIRLISCKNQESLYITNGYYNSCGIVVRRNETINTYCGSDDGAVWDLGKLIEDGAVLDNIIIEVFNDFDKVTLNKGTDWNIFSDRHISINRSLNVIGRDKLKGLISSGFAKLNITYGSKRFTFIAQNYFNLLNLSNSMIYNGTSKDYGVSNNNTIFSYDEDSYGGASWNVKELYTPATQLRVELYDGINNVLLLKNMIGVPNNDTIVIPRSGIKNYASSLDWNSNNITVLIKHGDNVLFRFKPYNYFV